MKLFVFTQVHENYGSETAPRWKGKCGDTYCVANVTYAEAANLGSAGLSALVNERVALLNIECHDGMYTETVMDWSLEEDDYVTQDEQDQLKYEGKIMYPHKDYTQGVAA